MRRLRLDEWEKEYITAPIMRFDQKYAMGRRDVWDDSLKERMSKLIPMDTVSDIPGCTLVDWAMRVASRSQMGKLSILNVTKPNQEQPGTSYNKFGTNDSLLKPPEGMKLDINDAQKLTLYIKKAAIFFGADLVGISRIDQRWIYSHTYNSKNTQDGHKPLEIPEEYTHVIVMGFGGGYQLRRYFPAYNNTWSTNGYRQVLTNAHLAAFIQYLGYKAIDCSFDDVALAIPQAMQAGLGQIGRNNLLITPEFGSSVRLGQILTDLPLIPDAPIDFGVTEFCNICNKCADMCPSHSISHDNRKPEPLTISSVGGELKWQFNPETCHMNLYGYNKPCQLCISVCPFTKPNTRFHRFVRKLVDKVRWADPFYLAMDNVFRYGKSKNLRDFWDKWDPRDY